MSTSSTPMFCLLVKAPISVHTRQVNSHNTGAALCPRRLLYSRPFNPVVRTAGPPPPPCFFSSSSSSPLLFLLLLSPRLLLCGYWGFEPRRECDRPGRVVLVLVGEGGLVAALWSFIPPWSPERACMDRTALPLRADNRVHGTSYARTPEQPRFS